MTIYSPSGEALIDAPILNTARVRNALRGDYCVVLQFIHREYIHLTKGAYIEYNGRKFEIRDLATPEGLTTASGYKYDLTFYSQASRMKDRSVFWLYGESIEATFQNTTTLEQYAQLLADNMNAFLGVTTWRVGSIPKDKSDVKLTVQFDGTKCWDALHNIADIFEVEAWVTDNIYSVTINFGKLERGDAIVVREGEIVKSIPARRGQDSEYGNRFFVFGGTKNIPADYQPSADGSTTNHVSAKRLHLPSGYNYIDAYDGLTQPHIIEQVVNIDDVFPSNELTITKVTTRKVTSDGVESYIYTIKCSNQIAVNVIDTLGLKFTSGGLEGREFELLHKDDNTYEIVQQSESIGDSSINVPNEYLRPAVGDKFVLTGVDLPSQNIRIAEEELLARGKAYAKEHSADTDVYSCPTNPIYCSRNDVNFELGQRVTLMLQSYGDKGRSSRIQGYEKSLFNEYDATYEIGDNERYTSRGRLQRVENDIYRVATDIKVQWDKGSAKTNKIEQITAERDAEYQKWKGEQETQNDGLWSNSRKVYEQELEIVRETTNKYDEQFSPHIPRPAEWASYISAYMDYEPKLAKVVSMINPDPTKVDGFVDSRNAYYEARASLEASIGGTSWDVANNRAPYLDAKDRLDAEYNALIDEYITSLADYVKLTDSNGTAILDKNGVPIFVPTFARYEPLVDSDGKTILDKNGATILCRVPNAEWLSYQAFIDAADAYRNELEVVLATQGAPNITESYNNARKAYYEELNKITKTLTKSNNVRFLKDVFGEARVLDTYAAVLSSVIAVQDAEGNLRAGMYGGGESKLDAEGYKDDSHGTLMLFAGAKSATQAKDAIFRVYEDGATFGGIFARTPTTIDDSFFKELTSNDVIPFEKIGSLINAYPNEGEHYSIEIPSIFADNILSLSSGTIPTTPTSYIRGFIGSNILIYNRGDGGISFCGHKKDPNTGVIETSGVCYDDWIVPPGHLASLECKLGNGRIEGETEYYEWVYWDVKVIKYKH